MKLPIRRILIFILGTLGAIALIWYFGPLFSFAGIAPLASPVTRIFTMVGVAIIGWILYTADKPYQEKIHKRYQVLMAKRNDPSEATHLKKFREHFIGAIDFLKKTQVKQNHLRKSRVKLFNLPWFLVIGEQDSGKTALLTHSGLRFLLAKKFKKNRDRTDITRYCDWWGAREAVLLDTTGHFISADKTQKKMHFFWIDFLNLLSRSRRPAINGVIVTLSIEKLLGQNVEEQNLHFHTIKKRLRELQKKLGTTFPVYVVFTQIDCLAGFAEFFDNLNQKERQQVWGISFSSNQIADPLRIAENFDVEFDTLLSRINARLIHRLHHERNKDKRGLIKDFPLQVESLKKLIASFLKHISTTTTQKHFAQLRGLYFTSAIPKNNIVDRLLAPLKKTFALQIHEPRAPLTYKKSFFTRQLFNEVIFKDADFFNDYYGKPPKNWWALRISAVCGAVAFLAVCVVIWTQHFSENVNQMSQVEDAVVQYRLLAKETKIAPHKDHLAALNMLAQATEMLRQAQIPLPFHLGKQQQSALYHVGQKAYYHAVQQLVANTLRDLIKQEVSKGHDADNELLYGALKAYLMLGDAGHFNAKFIHHWMLDYWQNKAGLDYATTQTLKNHLDLIFKTTFKPTRLNKSLVREAKALLNSTPLPNLALAVLNNDFVDSISPYQLKIPNARAGLKIFTLNEGSVFIPGIYTVDNFANTYENLIPAATQVALAGNWVLGVKAATTGFDSEKSIDETRQFYIRDYIDSWQNVLAKLHIVQFATLEEAIPLIDSFVQPKSPLNQMLTAVKQNTHVTYNNVKTPISIRFQRFDKFLSQDDLTLFAVRNNLTEFQDYLVNIVNDKDQPLAAFTAAKRRMQEKGPDIFKNITAQADMAPFPINEWLNEVVARSWELMLTQAAATIQTAWVNEVLPEYNAQINNRYPLFPEASQQMTPQAFNHFFASSGTLDQFFSHYLLPFVTVNQPSWQWRKMNDKGLTLNESILAQFQRGLLIKNIYFPAQGKEFTLKFTIVPEALQPIVKSFAVSLDDVEAVYTQTRQNGNAFSWPMNTPVHSANVVVSSIDGKKVTDSETGDWAWFKMLDRAIIETTNDPRKLRVTFDVKGYGARVFVISDAALNPFSVDLLPNFRAPDLETRN